MSRNRRITGPGESYYHITTRVVDKRHRFEKGENVRNLDLLRRVEEFSGVQILSYCLMSNHLHILLRVPEREVISQTELLRRIGVLYGEDYRQKLESKWTWMRKHHQTDMIRAETKRYLVRMYDMGQFMKTFKQRLTMSYNARYGREGTLWESRYYSVLLEATPHVLSTVAAYIDRNPVRAHMVNAPEEYAFSSYAEACAGGEKAQAGLCWIYQEEGHIPDWNEVQNVYRQRIIADEPSSEYETVESPDEAYHALMKECDSIQNKTCSIICRRLIVGCDDFRKRVEFFCYRRWWPRKRCRRTI